MKNSTMLKTLFIVLSLLVFSASSFAQTRITGTITDASTGEALPGANVIEKGTSNGSISDVNGNYSITVSSDATLIFSFIGYATQEIAVGGRSVVDVALDITSSSLEEVVVVGYGTQRKEDLTGAVSLVDPEEMQKQASNDLTQMMQGRVSGVSITSDGQPGATPTVRIRGVSSINLSTEPLYVVDGFPLPGGIRDINPNDIESIQVLKDATAGAIYGNRAANGVVIITTKSGGKNQPLQVQFNAYYGTQTIPDRIPVLDREGYQTIVNEMMTNAGAALIAGNDPSSSDYIDDINTDWQEEGLKDGYIVNYNMNLSGGSDKTNYFVSLDYMDNEGTLVGAGPDYKRYSFRVNSESQLGKFKLGENFYFMRSDENPLLNTVNLGLLGGRPGFVNDLLQAIPTIPVLDPSREGGFGGADAIIHNSITLNVPGYNQLIDQTTQVNRLLANIYGELEIIGDLKYKLNLQYESTDITDELFTPQYDLGYFFPNPVASLTVGDRSSNSFLVENTLSYSKTFGQHKVDVLAGQTYQTFDFRGVSATATGLEKPYIRNLTNGTSFSVSDNIQESAIYSYIGRLNYSFDDRYLITANVRRDASSRFREENRSEIFPSVGVAWKVHNDFQLPAIISDLKIRGGIGQVGNQEIPNYGYQSVVNRGIPYQFGNERVIGGSITTVIDPSIRWETRTTRNVGFDVTLLEGKVEFTAEYYSNTTEDALLNLPIPLSTGSVAPTILTNAASLKNSGIELSAIVRQNFGDFYLEVAPNFYTLNNEVLDIGPLDLIQSGDGRTVVGRSVGEHYGWVFDGIFQDQQEIDDHATQLPGTAPGDIRFADISGPDGTPDGEITDDDRTFLGSGLPTYYYGINITAGYKNFDFTVFGSGSGGNLINSNLYRGLMPSTGFTNWHEDIGDRWTPTNPSRTVPRMVWLDPNQNFRISDRPGWLQDGDYFRINTISLGYTLPQRIAEKAHLISARFYVTLQNVHVFTSYKGYNPDFQAGSLNPGFDFGTFPRPRTTMIGVNLKF